MRGFPILLAALFTSVPALAAGVAVRAEPGASMPLGGPQSDRFGVGGGGSAKLGVDVASGYLDLQAAASAFGYSLKEDLKDTPGLVAFGAGLRVQRPRDQGTYSPWADVDGMYVRTGPLDRAGIAAAAGLAFSVDRHASTWVGPFARYMHVLQPESAGFDNADGKFLVLGLSAEFGAGKVIDNDKDGVLNEVDRCPDVPGAESNQGCPILDSDGDGVTDQHDQCVKQPGPPDNRGCPYQDTDKDGLLDKDDACPTQAGPAETRGCPVLDSDKDGFADKDDRCPTQPGTVHGCPDPDGDGLVGQDDQCPDTPGKLTEKGCPVYKQVVVTDTKLELGQKIFFAFGKTEILTKSFPLLDEVSQALKDRKTLRVQIEGHTDAVGDDKKNLELSQGRADAVATYLADHGVARDRIIAKGFGSKQPLESNKTAEGRERNRRVEFVILDDKAMAPTSVEKKK